MGRRKSKRDTVIFWVTVGGFVLGVITLVTWAIDRDPDNKVLTDQEITLNRRERLDSRIARADSSVEYFRTTGRNVSAYEENLSAAVELRAMADSAYGREDYPGSGIFVTQANRRLDNIPDATASAPPGAARPVWLITLIVVVFAVLVIAAIMAVRKNSRRRWLDENEDRDDGVDFPKAKP